MRNLFMVLGLALGLSGAAQAQSPNPLEQEYIKWYMAHTAARDCPNLVEDWVHSVMDGFLSLREMELSNWQGIPEGNLAGFDQQAHSFACDDPRLAAEVQQMNQYALFTWSTYYAAYSQAPSCNGVLLYEESEPFSASFAPVALNQLSATAGEATITRINQISSAMAPQLEHLCLNNTMPGAARQIDLIKVLLQGPDDQRYWSVGDRFPPFRSRNFKSALYQPFTHGEFTIRETLPVSTAREYDPERPNFRGADCGGYLGEIELALCQVFMDERGRIVLEADLSGLMGPDHHFVPMLRVRNPVDGSIPFASAAVEEGYGGFSERHAFTLSPQDIAAPPAGTQVYLVFEEQIRQSGQVVFSRPDLMITDADWVSSFALMLDDLKSGRTWTEAAADTDLFDAGLVAQVMAANP